MPLDVPVGGPVDMLDGSGPSGGDREATQALAREIDSMEFDPYGFVMFAFPWGKKGTVLEGNAGPYVWQREILQEVGSKLRSGVKLSQAIRLAVSSGHGVGKSAAVSWLILWALSTRTDTRGVVTANTETQLRTKTWAELGKWHRLAINSSWFHYTATSIYSSVPEHEKTWRIDAIPWSETRTESFAGLHNQGCRILVLFDEASAIPDVIWNVTEGALTDEGTQIIWSTFGNPTRNTGKFHELFTRLRHRWSTKKIDSRSVPGTNKRQIAEWMEDYGEDSDFFRVRVRGDFPRQAAYQFISSESVSLARIRDAICGVDDPLVLGVDVARFGSNQSIIIGRRGDDARNWGLWRYSKVNTMFLAGEVVKIACGQHKADAVFIDEGGVGGGVVDRCRQLGLNVIGVQFGGKASPSPLGVERTRYLNRRTQIWGEMREWLTRGAIPDDDEIASQLTGPEYTVTTREEIALERKVDMEARGVPSPDIADALALTFAERVVSSRISSGPHGGGDVEIEWEPI